jgi:hypothetical protein
MRVFVALFASVLIFCCEDARAKTAACPCSPCKCSPCTCGGGKGGGGKGDKHHKDKEGHGHDRVGVGVGANVDLSGVGQRKPEADPFAVSGGGSTNTPRTQEKHKPRAQEREVPPANPFSDVQLTGQEAKGETPPPGALNVSDDNETPPQLPKGETLPAPTMDDLKKAQGDYHTAEKQFLDGDPDYQAALKQLKANVGIASEGSTAEKKVQKAIKKMKQRKDHFAQSDGKKLFDDWMKAYQALNKPGTDISDDLVPPDDLEKAKHDLAKAQNALKEERDVYDAWKNYAVTNSNGVKNIQTAIDELKKKTHFSEKDAQADRDKVKQLQADLDNAKKQVEKDWASTDAAKDQMKKVQQAEKGFDKAKTDFKPYEGVEKNLPKAAANP